MAKITEIRVHGVSGTSAASMLKSAPLLGEVRPGGESYRDNRPPGSPAKRHKGRAPIEVWDPADPPSDIDDMQVMAYNWSRLTSGRRRHAFWLLLLPYTLINVGGWMLPPRRERNAASGGDRHTVSARGGAALDVLLRLAGACVTATFVLYTAAIVLDLTLAKCRPGSKRCVLVDQAWQGSPRGWLIAGAIVTVLIATLVFAVVTRDKGREQFAEAARARLDDTWHADTGTEADPVRRTITDRSLWLPRRLRSHLAVLHAAVAINAVTWVLVAIVARTGDAPVTWWLHVVVTGYLLAALIAASTWAPSDRLRNWAHAAVALASAAFVVALVDTTELADRPWDDIQVGQGVSTVSVALVLVLAVVGAVVWLAGAGRPVSTSGAASMIVLGGLVGVSFGAGMYMLVRELLLGDRADLVVDGTRVADLVTPIGGIDWAALAFLTFLLVQIGAVLCTMAFAPLHDTPASSGEGLRAVTDRLNEHLFYPAAFALFGAAVFLAGELGRFGQELTSPWDDDAARIGDLQWADALVLVLLVLVAGLGLRLVWRYASRWVFAAAVVGVAAAVAYYLVFSPQELSVAGITIEVNSFRNLAVSLALFVPAGFIVSRMWTMLTDRKQRRGVGILWDIGSFWPRWYHPFAPPPYSPVAVPDLAGFVQERTERDDERVLVAAHSQGSIISMAALLALDRERTPWHRIALLTYGNPVCQLYRKLFPAQFAAATIEELATRVASAPGDPAVPRWYNLWRRSDPIGGPVARLGDRSVDIAECLPDGHSDYELTDAFRRVRRHLVDELG